MRFYSIHYINRKLFSEEFMFYMSIPFWGFLMLSYYNLPKLFVIFIWVWALLPWMNHKVESWGSDDRV